MFDIANNRNWVVRRYINGELDPSYKSSYFDEMYARNIAARKNEDAGIAFKYKAVRVI
jgi:hypothetical protein